MTPEQFWYGDMRLFGAYQKAYIRDASYKAWLNGQYSGVGFEIAYQNCWTQNKSDIRQFPDWIDPIVRRKERQLTSKEREHKGREELLNQAQWFSNLLHGK